jgi:hypothetical protein
MRTGSGARCCSKSAPEPAAPSGVRQKFAV